MAKVEWYATTKLKEKREELKISQKEMADLIHLNTGRPCSESLYQKWELGAQNIPALRVIELGKILKVDWPELVEQRNGEQQA